MGGMEYEEGIKHVQTILQGITTTKPSSDVVVTKTLFAALSVVYEEAESVEDSVLVANTNLAVLEEVCSGKSVLLSKCLQTLIVAIYARIVVKSPGYAVRNIAASYLTLGTSKSAPSCAKECAINVLGLIFATRSYDCGSLITDAATGLTKLAKGTDLRLRVASLKALYSMVERAGVRMGDCHADLVKLVSKCTTDRGVEIRLCGATLLAVIARSSAGCTTVTIEALLGAVGKGTEDEVAVVQEAYCQAIAAIFHEQIRAQLDAEEQAKIGLARGISTPAEPVPKPKRRLISKIASAMKNAIEEKKTVEDYHFRSVVTHLLKNIVKATTAAGRAAQVSILTYLIQYCVEENAITIDSSQDGNSNDLDWFVKAILDLLRDPTFAAQSYDDQMFFRARLSYLFRTGVTSQLSEGQLTSLATLLTQLVSRLDIDSVMAVAYTHTEQELQFALGELSHVVSSLGEAAASVADVCQAAATVHLRHPIFGVRSSAAYVLASLAATLPGTASIGLRASLSSAQLQARQLAAYDGTDEASHRAPPSSSLSVPSSSSSTNRERSSSASSREQERLQRMYFFHGHTMVLSIFLRNDRNLASSLPKSLVIDILDFGLELLKQDVLNSSVTVRHIRCSLVRAGSLIIASCLCTGHKVARMRLSEIVGSCTTLFKTTLAPALSDETMMYELMCIEAALVCVATLLWASPEVFIQDMDTLPLILEGLEMTLRAAKGKYHPKFKAHFRYRTLHSVLMECFAWLPPGSFAHCNSMQPLFVEALRVLRDAVTAGSDCVGLVQTNHDTPFGSLKPSASSSSSKPTTRQAAAVAHAMDTLYHALPLSTGHPPGASEEQGILNICAAYTSAKTWNASAPSSQIQASHHVSCQELPLNEMCMMLKLESGAVALDKKENEAFLASFGPEGHGGGSRVVAEYPSVKWIQTSAPSVASDTRAINAAILLLASTFGYQSIEYQEKALQFFSQTMLGITGTGTRASGSSMSVFTVGSLSSPAQEEEKRKKERKSCAVLSMVLASLSAIVAALPCVVGETLVTVWGQVMVDRLCDLLSHSNSDIRTTAASTLATFCLICSGGGNGISNGVEHGVAGCRDFVEFDGHNNYHSNGNNNNNDSSSSSGDDPSSSQQSHHTNQESSENQPHQQSGQPITSVVALTNDNHHQHQYPHPPSTSTSSLSASSPAEGAWLIEVCLTRLATLISAGYERKGDSLHDCGGYVLALSKLWSRAHAYPNPDPTLPNSIIAHILDSLRRVDTTVSLSFRSHCVLALSSVIAHKLHEVVQSEAWSIAEAQEGSDSGLHPHLNPEKADFLGRKRRRRSEGASTGAWSGVGNNNSNNNGIGSSGGSHSSSFNSALDFNGGSQQHRTSDLIHGTDGGGIAVPPPLVIAPKRPSLGRGVSVSDGESSLYLNPDMDGTTAMDLLQLAERVCHIAEIHLVSINSLTSSSGYSSGSGASGISSLQGNTIISAASLHGLTEGIEDGEQLLAALQRLLAVTAPLLLFVCPLPADIPVLKLSLASESKPPGRAGDKSLPAHVTLYVRFARMWRVISEACIHPLARRETIRFTVLTAVFLPVHVEEDDLLDHTNGPIPGGSGWDNGQTDPFSKPPRSSSRNSPRHIMGGGGTRNVDLKAALSQLTEELRYQCGQGLLADIRVLQLCLVGIRVVMEKDVGLLLDDDVQTDVALFAALEWCLTHTPTRAAIAFSGLELTSRICSECINLSVGPSADGRDKETGDSHYERDNQNHHHHSSSHHHDHIDVINDEQDDDDDDVARFMAAAQGLLGGDIGVSGGGGPTVAHVQRTIENLLLRLSRALTRTRDGADHLVVPWVLFCRAISLGLRPNPSSVAGPSGGGPGPGANEEGDEDTRAVQEVAGGSTRSSGGRSSLSSPSAPPSPQLSTPQQFVAWHRERAVLRAQGLATTITRKSHLCAGGITNINRITPGSSGTSVRLRVKSIAVRCATASLKSLSPRVAIRNGGGGGGGGGMSPHVDVSEAMKLTVIALTQAQQPQSKKGISGAGIAAVSGSGSGADDGQEGLMSVPCYLSLCLHDLVTTACACATFTVDDHLVPTLQRDALLLLQQVVSVFKRSLDPDDHTLLLQQYTSQITSAIRPALDPSVVAPALLKAAGGIICDLVEEQLLGDKTALRRLVKHIVTFDTTGVSTGRAEGAVTVAREGLSVLTDHRWYGILRGGGSSSSDSGNSGKGSSSGGVSSSSHSSDQDACEDSAALAHITRIHLSARLYLLTKEPGRGLASSIKSQVTQSTSNKAMDEAKAAVQELIRPQVPTLMMLWLAVVIDAARVLQGSGTFHHHANGNGSTSPSPHAGGLADAHTNGTTTSLSAEIGVGAEYGLKATLTSVMGGFPGNGGSIETGIGGVTGDQEPLYVPPRSTGSEVRAPSPVSPTFPSHHSHPHISPSPSPTASLISIQPPSNGHTTGRTRASTNRLWSHAGAENDPRSGGLTYSPLVTTIGLISHLRPALRRALPTTLLACATAMHGLSSTGSTPGNDGDSGHCGEYDAEIRLLFAVAVTVMEEGYQRHQRQLRRQGQLRGKPQSHPSPSPGPSAAWPASTTVSIGNTQHQYQHINTNIALMMSTIATLASLSTRPSSSSSSPSLGIHIISMEQWTQLLSFGSSRMSKLLFSDDSLPTAIGGRPPGNVDVIGNRAHASSSVSTLLPPLIQLLHHATTIATNNNINSSSSNCPSPLWCATLASVLAIVIDVYPTLIDSLALPLTHTSATNTSSSSSGSSRSSRGEAMIRSILKGSIPVGPAASTQGQGLAHNEREYSYSTNSSSCMSKWQQLQGTLVMGSGGMMVGGLTALITIIGNLAIQTSSLQSWEPFLLRLLLLLVVQAESHGDTALADCTTAQWLRVAYTSTTRHDSSPSSSLIRRPSEVLQADEDEEEKWGEEKECGGKKMDVRTMVVAELMQWVDEMNKKPRDHGHVDTESFARGVSALLRLWFSGGCVCHVHTFPTPVLTLLLNDHHNMIVKQTLLTGLQWFLSHPRLMTITIGEFAPVESQRLAVLTLVSTLYPTLLMSLVSPSSSSSSSSTMITELEGITIQLLFIAGTLATTLQGSLPSPTPTPLHFVTLLVPTLCEYLMKQIGSSLANGEDLGAMNHGVGPGPAVSACGHGLTQLAQTNAEPFRNVVGNLSVSHRSVLQTVMRYALQHPMNPPGISVTPSPSSTSTSFATFTTTTDKTPTTMAVPPPSSSTLSSPSPQILPPLAPTSDTNKLPPLGRSSSGIGNAPNKLGFDISKFKSVAPVKPTQPAYTFKREVFTAKVDAGGEDNTKSTTGGKGPGLEGKTEDDEDDDGFGPSEGAPPGGYSMGPGGGIGGDDES